MSLNAAPAKLQDNRSVLPEEELYRIFYKYTGINREGVWLSLQSFLRYLALVAYSVVIRHSTLKAFIPQTLQGK